MDSFYDILAESGCEIHAVKDTPGGSKKYEKASKEQMVETIDHVNEVGKVQKYLENFSFEERFEWIEKTKAEGNKFFSEKLFGKALDKYLNALYGMNFPDQTIEMEKKVNFGLKVPLLNNMSICLLKVKEYKKVISMTEQVLIIDPDNFKALLRRASAFLELGNLAEAKDLLSKAKKVAFGKEDLKQVTDLLKIYNEKYNKEQEFAK